MEPTFESGSFESFFQSFLNSRPSISELTKQVLIGTNWKTLGTVLEVDGRELDSISEKTAWTEVDKAIKMFQVWLSSDVSASRRKVLDALKEDALKQNKIVADYKKHLNDLCVSICNAPISIFEKHKNTLAQVIFEPAVEVAQLLYSKGCLDDKALDDIEDHSRSLDDKRSTLLAAMRQEVSSNCRKFDAIVAVLLRFKETQDISSSMKDEYAEVIGQENFLKVQAQEVASGDGGDRYACDILRKYYGDLSESITEPVCVASYLRSELIISPDVNSNVISYRMSPQSVPILLKAVRHAVHANPINLEKFVTVLRKFPETEHIGEDIFKEYVEYFGSDTNRTLRTTEDTISNTATETEAVATVIRHQILIPRNMKKQFRDMRLKFGRTLYQFQLCFDEKLSNKLKSFILVAFSDLKSQLTRKKKVNDIIGVVVSKCSIIDVHPLEIIAVDFNIKGAIKVITTYKEVAQQFCTSVTADLCLNETLQATPTPSRLTCDTVLFTFNWEPDETTLQDIKDVLDELEPLNKFYIQIDKVGSGQSVVVTCYCPAEYINSLTVTVLDKIEALQKRGLKEFVVGNYTVWADAVMTDKNEAIKARDYEELERECLDSKQQLLQLQADLKEEGEHKSSTSIPSEPESNEDLKKQLQTQRSLGKRRSIENEDLKFNIKEKDEKIAALENDIKTLQNKLQETEKLKATLDNNGHVAWKSNQVSLTNPSAAQCWEVIPKLEGKHETVHLEESSSIIVLLLVPPVLQRQSVKSLHLFSTPFRHETIICLSTLLSNNESLRELWIMNCAICGDGFNTLVESLQNNTSLTELNVQLDIDITLTSSESLRQLLRVNHTLNVLHLCGANFEAEGLAILLESLKTNETLKQLYLDKKHETICSSIPSYSHISDRLVFSS